MDEDVIGGQKWSKEDDMMKSWLAKHRWDNTSVEAEFHKRLGFLSKRHQGLVMHHFREVIRAQSIAPQPDPDPYCANDGTCNCAKFGDNPDNCERKKERKSSGGLK